VPGLCLLNISACQVHEGEDLSATADTMHYFILLGEQKGEAYNKNNLTTVKDFHPILLKHLAYTVKIE
jgi:hypothetical protein